VGAVRGQFSMLFSWEEHHRRLLARLAMVVLLTLVVDAVGSVAIYYA